MITKEIVLKEITFIKETSLNLIKKNAIDIPVICTILDEKGKRLSLGVNKVEKDNSLTSHAEINAINEAKKHNFKNCSIFINLEPCIMCLGAIITNGFSNLYYLVKNTESGGITKYDIHSPLEDHFLDDKEEKEKFKKYFSNLRNK